MVTEDFLTFELKPLARDLIDPAAVVIRYDALTDTLFVHLFGTDRRATILELDNHRSLRIDMQTHEVVGLQLECFMEILVPRNPQFLSVAELAGVDEATIAAARLRISPDRGKQSIVDSIFGEFKNDLLLTGT